MHAFIPTQCLGKICLTKEHVPYSFGDSILDVDNNYIIPPDPRQISPYGETFFKYPTGRASNGRLIPDFLAEYANLELIPPYLHPGYHRYVDGANFASGGAGTLDETRQGLVVALNTQLKYFKKLGTLFKQRLGEKEAKKLLSKAVYLTSVGSNDYLFRFTSNSSVYSPKEYVNLVIGFKEGKTSCCGTGPYNGIYSCGGKRAVGPKYELCRNISDYVFFDAPHPSEKAYQQFTEQIWSGTPNVIQPHSLKELFDH
ncbi:gdsl esterase/lipase 1 [Quercus suber]|uniref:Gdsl esterase/lipase 1 n=1 Tax=Quercus suber TaxID=58331 RepID=A0AAW0L6I5_QUESU